MSTETMATGKAAATPRKKSKLSQHGDAAKHAAERDMLLKSLRAHAWNLTHTARDLDIIDASTVLRAIDRYELRDEYERERDKT